MPDFEKLSMSEIENLRRRRTSRQDLSEYLSYLSGLKSGDWGRIRLKEGESQRAVKRRLTVSSKQIGKQIKYRRGDEGRIVFEVR